MRQNYFVVSTENGAAEDLLKTTSFRGSVNWLRNKAKELRSEGCEAKLLPYRDTGVFGYAVTKPSREGQDGEKYDMIIEPRIRPESEKTPITGKRGRPRKNRPAEETVDAADTAVAPAAE